MRSLCNIHTCDLTDLVAGLLQNALKKITIATDTIRCFPRIKNVIHIEKEHKHLCLIFQSPKKSDILYIFYHLW